MKLCGIDRRLVVPAERARPQDVFRLATFAPDVTGKGLQRTRPHDERAKRSTLDRSISIFPDNCSTR